MPELNHYVDAALIICTVCIAWESVAVYLRAKSVRKNQKS